MLDESIVQFFGRIRVHATKRVESKRNEVMAVPVTVKREQESALRAATATGWFSQRE